MILKYKIFIIRYKLIYLHKQQLTHNIWTIDNDPSKKKFDRY